LGRGRRRDRTAQCARDDTDRRNPADSCANPGSYSRDFNRARYDRLESRAREGEEDDPQDKEHAPAQTVKSRVIGFSSALVKKQKGRRLDAPSAF
jgi:hypothetical protein